MPTLQTQARQLLRENHIAWRPSILTAAVAYAVAFSTQAHERDRHRVPVHVVDSTGDGLSRIMKPFAVIGNAENVEYGLQTLLQSLLFPLLLGHGLYDQPSDPRRQYGVAEDDTRPPGTRRDAHISHSIDRDAQVSVVLGYATSGLVSQKTLWEGPAGSTPDIQRFGGTAPVNDQIDELRRHARVEAARATYDHGGPLSMTADNACNSIGWWIPADDAPHAVRQAQSFLTANPRIDMLWAGPSGFLPEPIWVCVDLLHFNAHSTGPTDVPWISVSDGHSTFGVALADIAVLCRVPVTTPLTPVHRS